MAIGERIKRIRNFRKLTQAQLGEAVGLSDVRIRQYEIGNRTPKEDMIQELAKALNCNYRSIYEPSLYAAEDVMYALFELDEHYNMPLYEVTNPEDPTEKHIAVGFDYSLLDDFLNTWKKEKEDLASGKITKEEYFEWKINWPPPKIRNTCIIRVSQAHFEQKTRSGLFLCSLIFSNQKKTATPHKMRNCGLYLSFYDTKSKITQ